MKLPDSIIPLLETITSRNDERTPEFWLSDDPALIDEYVDLANQIFLCGLDPNDLPQGYSLVAALFDWESNCQMSGWYAIENRASEIERVAEAYRKVGLEAEGTAILAAAQAWSESSGDSDATGRAYSEVPNRFRKDVDRWQYLISFFNKNARELFYEAEK